MNEERTSFYRRVVDEFILDKKSSVLICGGGSLDHSVFYELGFCSVTISNLDSRMHADEYKPFLWRFENAESLSFPDEHFDYVVIHAAIHHASLPHKVLTEMYRVAKQGVLAFEARDSIVMRCMELLGFSQTYEHAAVFFNNCAAGGVNNSEISNYVYRWTEREVEKTIKAYSPCFKHKFTYRYATAFPSTPTKEHKSSLKLILLKFIRPIFKIFVLMFPRQQNLFAFYIPKPTRDALFPWLYFDEKERSFRFNRSWGVKKYKTSVS